MSSQFENSESHPRGWTVGWAKAPSTVPTCKFANGPRGLRFAQPTLLAAGFFIDSLQSAQCTPGSVDVRSVVFSALANFR